MVAPPYEWRKQEPPIQWRHHADGAIPYKPPAYYLRVRVCVLLCVCAGTWMRVCAYQ